MESAHAKLSPSSMYRIIACPASVRECSTIPPQPPSSYAEHGTMLHEKVVEAWNETPGWFKGLEYDDKNYVHDCLDYLKQVLLSCTQHTVKMEMEARVDLESWGLGDIWGTCDIRITDLDRGVVHIIDWKFGQGVQVFAENNEQAMVYAAGAVGFQCCHCEGVEEIHIHIIQPPLNHFDEWVITYNQLERFIGGPLSDAIDMSKREDAPYNPGTKQCRFCPASMKCVTRYKKHMDNAITVFSAFKELPSIKPEELSKALKAADEYDTYIKALRLHAHTELHSGRPFPGYKLVHGRSTRKWANPEQAENWLAEFTAIGEKKLYTPGNFISPAQAEKLDKSLKKSDEFKALVNKPKGKPILVDEDDKRDAIEPEPASDVFKEFSE